MSSPVNKPVSTAHVVIAFATVYIVWGSTYFFIRMAVAHIPPMLLGCMRFLLAGLLMLGWCVVTKEKVFVWSTMRPAIISGLLLLFVGNGALIWSEQYVASSLAAILLASGPIWFVLLDSRKWKENFQSRATIMGLVVGFVGVILLFWDRLFHPVSGGATSGGAAAGGVTSGSAVAAGGVTSVSALADIGQSASDSHWQMIALVVIVLGSISWASGSLYAKYNSSGSSNSVNAGWQMLAAGVAFVPASWISGEFAAFRWESVTTLSWLSMFYLVTMGSLAGYSAFVWLLQVRSATQVSTHAYVNPVVAVLLGVFFANETMSPIQLLGLAIILVSVLLINLAKYRAAHPSKKEKAAFAPAMKTPKTPKMAEH